MEQEQIAGTLEALLFVSSKPLRIKDFVKILELDEVAIRAGLDALMEAKKTTGVTLLENNGEYQLATNSKYSTAVKNFLNAELREKLTDATVEVLAIIAYRQPISKVEIEAIRGVNSQYSIRNLLMRGLIEKVSNPSDARSFLYQTTTEFLMHLGLTSAKDLPDFAKLVEHIKLPQTPALERPENANPTQTITEAPAESPSQETAPEIPVELPTEEPTKENSPSEEDEEEEFDDDDDEDEE